MGTPLLESLIGFLICLFEALQDIAFDPYFCNTFIACVNTLRLGIHLHASAVGLSIICLYRQILVISGRGLYFSLTLAHDVLPTSLIHRR